MKKPELLAPAGDFTCLQAALDAGADAVYFGLDEFNMRVRSGVNFTRDDLPEIRRRTAERGVRAYLALNAIVFEGELARVEDLLAAARPFVDAAIVADWGVIGLCRRLGVPFHVSTQFSTSNAAAVRFLASQGAARVVLARECTLPEVAAIAAAAAPTEIECFVHGAQCVAESGRCFMSHEAFGKSACRGECTQPCRRRYLVKAVDFFEDGEGRPVHETDTAFLVEPRTILSAKDLCSLPFLDRLAAAGIASFKIEGRARSANYVRTVVSAYRRAIDALADGTFAPALADRLAKETETVFHRGFSRGLYFGRPGRDQFSDAENSLATTVRRHIGVVIDYFAKAGIAQVAVQDHPVRPGDPVQIHGKTTGVVELTVGELRRDDETPAVGEKGTWVTFRCPRCRVGDKVFFVETRAR
jgi:putative protease